MRLVILFLLIPFIARTQIIRANPFYKKRVTSGWTQINIDFRATSTTITKWNVLSGDPGTSVISDTDLEDTFGVSTGVGITSIATANWITTTGSNSNDAVTGVTGGNYFGSNPPASVYQSIWYNNATVTPARFDTTKPQIRLSGLDPAKAYEIIMCGGDGTLGFDANPSRFKIVGLTSPGNIDVDGDITNITTGATFTIIQPKADGTFDIWFNTVASPNSDLICVAGIIIREAPL